MAINVYDKLISYFWMRHFSINTIAAIVADLCREVDSVASEYRYGIKHQIAVAADYCELQFGTEATVEALTEAGADPEVILEAQAMKAKA